MLRNLRAPGGGPAPSTRFLAAVLVIGMFVAAAPAAIPVVRWVVVKIADNII